MRTTFLLLAVFTALFASTGAAEARRKLPIVAVFGIQDNTGKFSTKALSQLTDYLMARIAEGGVFKVVPKGQIKGRLVAQKKDSFKACYDQQCQIDIGRELAANKSLATQILKVGTKCAVVSTLYDLKQSTTERSATTKGTCHQDALVSALEVVATRIKGGAAGAEIVEDRPNQPRTGLDPKLGYLIVKTDPEGASIYLNGSEVGTSPRMVPVQPGRYTLRLAKAGHQPAEMQVEAQAGAKRFISTSLAQVADTPPPPPPPGGDAAPPPPPPEGQVTRPPEEQEGPKGPGLLRPGTRRMWAGLFLGGGLDLSDSVSQFKLSAVFGFHFASRSSGPALALNFQSSFGANDYDVGFTILEILPRFVWDIPLSSKYGIYIAPHAGAGYTNISGDCEGCEAWHGVTVQVGVDGKLILADRFLLFVRVLNIDIQLYEVTGTDAYGNALSSWEEGYRYDFLVGGAATF